MNKKIEKLFEIPLAEKIGLMEAVLFLSTAKIRIKFSSFKKIASHIKKPLANSLYSKDEILIVKRSIRRVHNRLPWENKCLPQALAAVWMLKRRNVSSELYFGLLRNEEENNELKAHAWVISSAIFVCGQHGHKKYTVVSRIDA